MVLYYQMDIEDVVFCSMVLIILTDMPAHTSKLRTIHDNFMRHDLGATVFIRMDATFSTLVHEDLESLYIRRACIFIFVEANFDLSNEKTGLADRFQHFCITFGTPCIEVTNNEIGCRVFLGFALSHLLPLEPEAGVLHIIGISVEVNLVH